ncbi:carbohydrate-binding protein [Clostridium beijerinckii]|uniref:carbohydrate-binding protein n=1 Tax=Clostridium beijerinckii TaxID=1520 RepID=UPI0028BDBBC7|nr:carbohydrate-binding protein [Clostridium beijerinckii]
MVSYNNNNYKAKWWTQGDKPGASDVWELIGAATPTNPSNPITPTTPTNPSNPTDPTNPSDPGTSYPAWDSSKAYVNGDIVSYNNNNYKAKWWTQGDKPGASDVWELIGAATQSNPKY